jgi:hydrogenase maturation protein HypF
MGGMAPQSARDPLRERSSTRSVRPSDLRRVHIRIEGIVQGVGFRPYVYRLSTSLGLAGWVRNTSGSVIIEVEGPPPAVQRFLDRLPTDAPPLAQIHGLVVEPAALQLTEGFSILQSSTESGRSQLVSPDVATCDLCLHEVLEPSDRRHRYAFTNCTDCGPRFTIITAMPYDRPNTTMASFTMCPDCQAEYDDPGNRRFHAQPNACPVCGPSLSLLDAHGNGLRCADPLTETVRLLQQGQIVAIKGLGGFLLACDATSPTAVRRLRERKHRPSKPFAVMLRALEAAKQHCDLTPDEESLLTAPSAPIVLAKWNHRSSICGDVAPGLLFLGIMLPYTPLHHLLVRECNLPLVMTSGNLSEEPIVADNDEALARLHGIADSYLVHNRPIHSRYDDSVAMVVDGAPQFLRRARGYAPRPLQLPYDSPSILAVGPQMKNTFCLADGDRAFVSQHIGDLDCVETIDHFERTIELYRTLFHIEPVIVAHDLHPDYASTRYALDLVNAGLGAYAVQHHHAHIASCMVENAVSDPVIGVAFDGSGLGSDGHIWGGEFLVCDYASSRRAAHLEYLPLPGGDAAILRPYRTAAAYIATLFGPHALSRARNVTPLLGADERGALLRQIETGFNTPLTSSMGRLFDAVAALAGVRSAIDYDGQAAIELEMAAHRHTGALPSSRYTFDFEDVDSPWIIRVAPVLEAVLHDLARGERIPLIAASLHEAVARMALEACVRISRTTGIVTVALSGGVFQNRILAERVPRLLRDAGFRVLTHVQLPSNDGCVSLGQAAIAAHRDGTAIHPGSR